MNIDAGAIAPPIALALTTVRRPPAGFGVIAAYTGLMGRALI